MFIQFHTKLLFKFTFNSYSKCNKSTSEPVEIATCDEKPINYSLNIDRDDKDDVPNENQVVVADNNTEPHRNHRLHHHSIHHNIHNKHQCHNLTVEELDTPTDYTLKYHEEESKTHDYNLIVRY